MSRCTSKTFFRENVDNIFGPQMAMTDRYIAQDQIVGYLRTNLERQKIVDYVRKAAKRAYDYGFVTF